MSQLRSQLRKIIPRLFAEANKLRDPEARGRWMRMRQITESGKSLAQACAFYGWSEDAYRKWGHRLRKCPRIESLFSRSRKPYRSPLKTKPRKEKKVLQLRRADPSLGPQRISNELERYFNIKVPASTVYAILKRAGAISIQMSQRLTKRHLKRYRRPFPGYLQMDFKYVPFKVQGRQLYQLSCVDHHSSWRFIRIYDNKSATSVRSFLEELEVNCPFPIEEIQTDNGAEFTDKFSSREGVTGLHPMDVWCARNGIRHRLIPVGVKELNGKVENTHKQDDREFYSQGPYRDLNHIQVCSKGYNLRWNRNRATNALGWNTPEQVLEQSYVRALALLMSVQNQKNTGLHKLDSLGNVYLPINEQKTRKINRPRKQGVVERYLKYLDWENKKKSHFLISLHPTMSQNSSFFLWRRGVS
jgi:transposase InsO family protein